MQITNINAKAAFFFLREAGRTLSDGGKVITCVHSFTPCMHVSAGVLAAAACLTLAQLLSTNRHQTVTSLSPCTPDPTDARRRLLTSQLGAGLTPLYALYLGAQAATEQYSKAAAKEFARRRISVNCVAPVGLWSHTSFPPSARHQ